MRGAEGPGQAARRARRALRTPGVLHWTSPDLPRSCLAEIGTSAFLRLGEGPGRLHELDEPHDVALPENRRDDFARKQTRRQRDRDQHEVPLAKVTVLEAIT